MRQHLAAAVVPAGHHDDRAGAASRRPAPRWPSRRRSTPRRRRRRRGAPSRTPYAASSRGEVVRRRRRRPRRRRGRRRPSADSARANVNVSSETSTAPPAVGLDQDEDHRAAPPAFEQVDHGRRGLGALAEHLDAARAGRRQQQPDPAGARGWPAERARLDLDLLGLHPAGEGRVARLDAALQHRDDRGQRDREGLRALGPVAAAVTTPSATSTVRDAVDDRPAERVGEPDPDLEVAAVGGVVAEQHQVVAPSRPPRGPRRPRRSRGPRRPGRTRPASASTSVAAVQPTASASRSCSTASAEPSGQHGRRHRRSPSAIWMASSTAHSSCVLTV